MSNRVARRLSYPKKAILTGAAMAAVAAPIEVGIMKTPRPDGRLMTPQVVTQSAAAAAAVTTPKFEVASVKPCSGDSAVDRGGRGAGGSSPGRLDLSCRTVMSIIQTAYTSGMPPLPPIEGGPAWINSERYAINAKAEGTPSGSTMRGPMLQALLQDRFQLKAHVESRDVPGYALTVAKGGPKLTPHQEGNCVDIGLVKPLTTAPPPHTPGERPVICGASHFGKGTGPNVTLEVPGVSLDYFARTFLGIAFWGRPVINKTGITGLFDIHLEFSPDESTPGPPGNGLGPRAAANPDGGPPAGDSIPAGPSIFVALQKQLGLKLEPIKGPRESLVIDRVERPSEN